MLKFIIHKCLAMHQSLYRIIQFNILFLQFECSMIITLISNAIDHQNQSNRNNINYSQNITLRKPSISSKTILMGNTISEIFFGDVTAIQEYKQALRKLRRLADSCKALYYQIEDLKKQLYPKAHNNFIITSQMSETSNQHLNEYCHLSSIQQQLNQISDEIKTKFQSCSDIHVGTDRIQAIADISALIEKSNNLLIVYREKVDLIRKGQVVYKENENEMMFSFKDNDHYAFNVTILQHERLLLTQQLDKTLEIKNILTNKPSFDVNKPFNVGFDTIFKQLISSIDQIEISVKQSQIAIKNMPAPNQAYIHKVFGEKILANNIIYKKITRADGGYCQLQFDVKNLSPETFEFNHSYCRIENMEMFASMKWDKVSVLNVVNCRIKGNGWTVLHQNAENFPQLRILWICTENFIDNMELDHLYKFPKLQFVYFENLKAKKEVQKKLNESIYKHMLKMMDSQIIKKQNQKRSRNLRVYF